MDESVGAPPQGAPAARSRRGRFGDGLLGEESDSGTMQGLGV